MPGIVSVDRIEGGLAILERADRTTLEVPLEQLPPGVRPGDCFTETPDGFLPDPDETARRRKSNIDLFNRLKNKNSKEHR